MNPPSCLLPRGVGYQRLIHRWEWRGRVGKGWNLKRGFTQLPSLGGAGRRFPFCVREHSRTCLDLRERKPPSARCLFVRCMRPLPPPPLLAFTHRGTEVLGLEPNLLTGHVPIPRKSQANPSQPPEVHLAPPPSPELTGNSCSLESWAS